MSESQPALLALPPPRSTAPAVAGLRASLRGAAAIPLDPVQPSRPALDAAFGSSIQTIGPDRSSDETERFHLRPPQRQGAAQAWIEARFFVEQSVPFLAQQLGQSGRLVMPTLDATVEIGAYAAAQQRADQAAEGYQALLDLRV